MPQSPVAEQPGAITSAEQVTVEDEGVEFCGLPICSPPGRFWLRADYLMWWTSGMKLPPLVTTSPQGTPQTEAGVLGQPTTTVLFGGETVNNDGHSGFRTILGMWLDACHVWGVEFEYFSPGGQSSSFNQTSAGDPILARPYRDVVANQENSLFVAFPGFTSGTTTSDIAGTIAVDAREYFQSVGFATLYNLCSRNACCDPLDPSDCPMIVTDPPLLFGRRIDLLTGLRYYNLSDSVAIVQNMTVTDRGNANNVTAFDVHDTFRARNDFYGGEIGLRAQAYRGRWSLEATTKIALGGNHQTVNIDGQSTVTPPGGSLQPPGFLAANSNIGTYQRDVFAMIPQLNLELGYQWNCHWRAHVGYDVLYWGEVARSSDQIDVNVDTQNTVFRTTPVTSVTPFPAFPNRQSSFYAHGVNVGAEYRF